MTQSSVAEGRWPSTDEALVELQQALARQAEAAVASEPWTLHATALVGGCFVAYAPGEAGPGKPGDRAWAAAVVWRPPSSGEDPRRVDQTNRRAACGGRLWFDRSTTTLRRARGDDSPRRADDVLAHAVVTGQAPAAYAPGLLARREGPILGAAVAALDVRPEVLLVDATGADHPRRAGLAIHLGAVTGIPTVGVTRRPLVATGPLPEFQRGELAPLLLDGRCVGFWVCTRTSARAVVAHAGWRTTPETAARTVLAASTPAARTPVPLQEARRVAREARALAVQSG